MQRAEIKSDPLVCALAFSNLVRANSIRNSSVSLWEETPPTTHPPAAAFREELSK